jgi:hypothetical protein
MLERGEDATGLLMKAEAAVVAEEAAVDIKKAEAEAAEAKLSEVRVLAAAVADQEVSWISPTTPARSCSPTTGPSAIRTGRKASPSSMWPMVRHCRSTVSPRDSPIHRAALRTGLR